MLRDPRRCPTCGRLSVVPGACLVCRPGDWVKLPSKVTDNRKRYEQTTRIKTRRKGRRQQNSVKAQPS